MSETIIKYNIKKSNADNNINSDGNVSDSNLNITTNDQNIDNVLHWKNGEGTFALVPRQSYNEASGESSVAIGSWTETTNEGEFAIGTFNKSTSGNTLFSIGDGVDVDHRHNIFEVGSGYTKINNTLSGTNAILSSATLSSLTANIASLSSLTANQLSSISGYIQTLLSDNITVDNLTVTKAAHFFKLIIDEIKATQGQIIITPANAIIDKVEVVDGNYRCYFRRSEGDKEIYNTFEVNDQIICQTFNVGDVVNQITDNEFTDASNWNASNTLVPNSYSSVSFADGVASFVPSGNTSFLAQSLSLLPSTRYTLKYDIKQDEPSAGDVSLMFHSPIIDTSKPIESNFIDSGTSESYNAFDYSATTEYNTQYVTFTTLDTLPSLTNVEFTCYTRETSGNCKTYIKNITLLKESQDNKYYWRKCVKTGSTSTTISGETVECNFIDLSDTDKDSNTNAVPEIGDEIVQLGNRTDSTRQAAIIISAYYNQFLDATIAAPSIVQYYGINDYNLSGHRRNVISRDFNSFTGDFTSTAGDDLLSLIQQTNSAITTEVTNRIEGDKKYFPILKPIYDTDFNIITDYKNNPIRYKGDADIYTTPTFLKRDTYRLRLFFSSRNINNVGITAYGTTFPNDLSGYDDLINLNWGITNNTIKCLDGTSLYEYTAQVNLTADGYYGLNFWESDEYLYIPESENEFETNYSRITQTSSAIRLQVNSLSGQVSTIDQKADNILIQVQECGINIDDKNITLNGDTNVNGTLTINDEDTGFLLAGSGGTTQISPKSLGGYNVFTAQTTNIIRAVKSYSLYISNTQGDNYVSATWSFTQSFGNVQSGAVIPLTLQATTFMFYNSGTVVTPSSAGKTEYKVYLNDTLIQTFTNYSLTAATIGSFTTSTAGELKIERTTTVYFNAADIQDNPILNGTLSYRIEVPNAGFQLIGYDGIATNFGTNANVYFGTDGAYMKYGNNGLAVTTSGLTKWDGTNWIPLNYLNVVKTTSTAYTATNNEDLIVTQNSSLQNILLPYPSTCAGRVVYIKRNADGNVIVRCNSVGNTTAYFLQADQGNSYAVYINQGSAFCMYISDGSHWIQGYMG